MVDSLATHSVLVQTFRTVEQGFSPIPMMEGLTVIDRELKRTT